MSEDVDGSPDAVIERVLRGEASEVELGWLARWRRASPLNEQHYVSAERLVAAASALRFTGAVIPPRPAAADVVAMVQTARREAAVRGRSRPSYRWLPWAVAAAAVLMAAIGLRTGETGGWEPAEVTTGATELATVKLGDGTVVRLAPSSRLRVIGGRTREVALEGRAFFAVTKAVGQPFRVHTAAATANVLGTRFELAADADGVRLTVVEGRVQLAATANTVEVSAGEASGVRDGEAFPPTPIASAVAAPAWLGNFLAFQTTPLRAVAHEIERVHGVRVNLADSALAGATITATFTDRPVADVVAVICAVVGAQCSWTDDTVTMTR